VEQQVDFFDSTFEFFHGFWVKVLGSGGGIFVGKFQKMHVFR
jgi:hypothetical protein